jgi:hypothetical protein
MPPVVLAADAIGFGPSNFEADRVSAGLGDTRPERRPAANRGRSA